MSADKSTTRILFVGDMHLGVLPSHVPTHLAETRGLKPRNLGPGAAWKRVVDAAIEQNVHAVALAGDLVDRNNALFEAYGLLETGLRRLEKAGIPVVAVAGNHDTETLPRLAELIETLHLLGPEGTWSSHLVNGDENLRIRLTGWSFPRPHVDTSPLPAPPVDSTYPTVGLLHADLDQASSQYAPVSSKELEGTGYRAWFLGHIHVPGKLPSDGRPFYLGSVTALHPGETGLHGPVLTTFDSREKLSMQRLALAPLRWENLVIQCDDLDLENIEILPLLLSHLHNRALELDHELQHTRALGFRITLKGAVPDPGPLRKKITAALSIPENLVTDSRDTVLFIDKISNETTLRVNLVELAQSDRPEGLLARRILVLENETLSIPGVPDASALRKLLISQGRETLREVDGKTPYLDLHDQTEITEIASRMASSGRRALEEILSRKEADHETR